MPDSRFFPASPPASQKFMKALSFITRSAAFSAAILLFSTPLFAQTPAVTPVVPDSIPADSVPDSIPDFDDATWLDDFVVTARKKLVKMDAEKLTYQASEDPDAQTLNTLDILRRVPMVNVDGQDNITVNGKSDFQVYVNGKPAPMLSSDPGKLLKAIPASSIDHIEVINNPGARYDAEGVGGILNIVMKSAGSLDGYTATVSATAGNTAQYGSLYVLAQEGKLSLSGQASYMHGSTPAMTTQSERTDLATGSLLSNFLKTKSLYNSLNASLNAEYKADDKNTFAVSGSVQRFPFHVWSSGNTSMQDASGAQLFAYDMRSKTRMLNFGVNASADYSHIFGANADNKLQLAYRFSTNPTHTTAENYFSALAGNTSMQDYTTDNRQNMVEHVAQADYSYPLGEKHLFGVGSKFTFRRSIAEEAERFLHHTTISAAYLTYGLKAGNFSLNAGTRWEHTYQSADAAAGHDAFSRDYDNFVPSLMLNYNISPIRSVSLGYNMRISRPGINYLDPFVNDQDPLAVTVGNPSLRAEKYHNLSLTWSSVWSGLMLNAQATYSFSNDGLAQLITMRDGVTYTTYSNSMRNRNFNLGLFLNYTLGLKTRLMVNSTTSFASMRVPGAGQAAHGWNQSIMAGLQQTLPWNIQLGANLFAFTRRHDLTMEGPSFFMHMFSLTKSLCNDRLSLSLVLVNPFEDCTRLKAAQHGSNMVNNVVIKGDFRNVMFSVSYRLGSLKPRTVATRSLDSDLAPVQKSGVEGATSPGMSGGSTGINPGM